MLDKEYEQLVHYVGEMIDDGVQLVRDGKLVDWKDTNIPEFLMEISRKKEEIRNLFFKSGDLLQNRYSGQKAAIINDDGKTVNLLPAESIITYPIDMLWYHYRKSSPSE